MKTDFRDFVMEIASFQPLNLYKVNGMISKYPDTNRINNIVSYKEYETNYLNQDWINFDLSKSFFDNLSFLKNNIKKPALLQYYWDNPNCNFVEAPFWASNWYLSFGIWDNVENILYSCLIYTNSTNIFNSLMSWNNSNNIYFCKLILNSYNIFYSKFINNCNNVRFSSNLTWCNDCILCDNLQNESYCINNQKYSKENYESEKIKILNEKLLYNKYISSVSNLWKNHSSTDSTWNWLINCVNVKNWYFSSWFKDSRNIMFGAWNPPWESMYDCIDTWLWSNDFYAARWVGDWSNNFYCSEEAWKSSYLFYCSYIQSCSFCLGCIWLKNKSYCILNKQYTKEEWYEKVDEIFGQMDADGTLGEFFPACMNPFYFNDTAAYLIDPSFTKEEVTAKWYLWRDEPIKVDIPETAQVISIDDLDQYESFDDAGVWKIDASILKKVIQDHEGNVYTIQWLEYNFLVKYGLPLPRKHWLDRMKENFRIS